MMQMKSTLGNTNRTRRYQYNRKKSRKRVGAAVLAVLLVFSLFGDLFMTDGLAGIGVPFWKMLSKVSAVWPVSAADDASSEETGTAVTRTEPQTQVDEDGVTWYLIRSVSELYWFADAVNSTSSSSKNVYLNAKLTADITIQTGVVAEGAVVGDVDSMVGWTPIGDSSHNFVGTFDGQGHTISGICLNQPSKGEPQGVFGSIRISSETINSQTVYHTGTVQNLNVVDSYLSGNSSNLGGLVGISSGGLVDNCSFSGVLTSTGTNAGGLVGSNTVQNNKFCGTVRDCSADVQLTSSNGAGGLVGQNNGIVEHCKVSGQITGIATGSVHGFCGGLVGTCGGRYSTSALVYGYVVNCYSTANVTSTTQGSYIGSLIGRASGGFLRNCYASGTATNGDGIVTGGIGEVANADNEESNYYAHTVTNAAGEDETAYYPIAYNCYYLGEKNSLSSDTAEYDFIPSVTADVLADGSIAYRLNDSNDTATVQFFNRSADAAFGQIIGTDATPVFLTEDKANAVHRVTYTGDYEAVVYANTSVSLPVCNLQGYTYAFTYQDMEKSGQEFDGTGLTEDATVLVTAVGVIPTVDDSGAFVIRTPEQLQWFSGYVNGTEELLDDDGTADATKADAVLANDIDMSGFDFQPIGYQDSGDDAEESDGDSATLGRYVHAYKGNFDGRYHVICNLQVGDTTSNQTGLFGCTYGARIERVGLEDAEVLGRSYVGGVCGKAVGTKIMSCYIYGKMTSAGNFVGGLVGYADIIREGEPASYVSKSLGTEVYRSYAALDMSGCSVSQTTAFGGISGGTAAEQTVGDTDAFVSYANDYYDSTLAAKAAGAVWMQVQATDTEEASFQTVDIESQSVFGCTTAQFRQGKVAWLLQLAAMQLGDSNITKGSYAAAEGERLFDGIEYIELTSWDLIWSQNVGDDSGLGDSVFIGADDSQSTPHFAEYLSDTQKAKTQVMRGVLINVAQIYEDEEQVYEQYGNSGFCMELAQTYPEYPSAYADGEPHYFVGWSTMMYQTQGDNTACEEHITTEPMTVTVDCARYACYNATGRIDVACDDENCTYVYGRTYAEEHLTVRAECTMSKSPDYLSYQWVEVTAEGEVALDTGANPCVYYLPVTIPVGEHHYKCIVTAENGASAQTQEIVITITKKPLSEDLFAQIEPGLYTGNAVEPAVSPSVLEQICMQASDYSVTYQNNVAITSADSLAQAVVTATPEGNYDGSVTLSFDIKPLQVTDSMFEKVGELDGDYYVGQVSIVPTAGYLLSGRVSGGFDEKGITVTATQPELSMSVSFYVKEIATGAISRITSVRVWLKQAEQETVATGDAEESKPDDTTPSDNTVAETSNVDTQPTVETVQPVANEVVVDEYGETISYYDGLGMPAVGGEYDIGNYRYRVTSTGMGNGTVTLKKVINRKLKQSNIPLYVDINGLHYLVTKVDAKAFYGLKYIQSVQGGGNVKTVGKYAFAKCRKLTKLVFGNKVTTIGAGAAKACHKLRKVTLGKRVKSIGGSAFAGDKSLKQIVIKSKQLKKAGKNALKNTPENGIIKVPAAMRSTYRKLLSNKGRGVVRVQ